MRMHNLKYCAAYPHRKVFIITIVFVFVMSEFMHDCPVQMAFYAKMSFLDSNIRAIVPIEKTHFTDATISGDEPRVDITLSKDIEGGKNYIIAPTGKDPFVLNASSSANTDSVLNSLTTA